MYEMPGFRTPYAMFSGLGVFRETGFPAGFTAGNIYKVASSTAANLRKNPFVPAEEYLIGGPDNVVARLDPGTEVELLSTVPATLGPQTRPAYSTTAEHGNNVGKQRTWLAVRSPDGKVGYIASENLAPSEVQSSSGAQSRQSPSSSAMTYGKTLYVGTDALNVRASPNSSAASVAKLTKGAAVSASESPVSGGSYTAGGKSRSDWRAVQIGSGASAKTGYVAEAFLVATQPSPSSGAPKPPADPKQTVEAPAATAAPDESASPEPTLFEKYRMPILIGGASLMVIGVGIIGYVIWSGRKNRAEEPALASAPGPHMLGARHKRRHRR